MVDGGVLCASRLAVAFASRRAHKHSIEQSGTTYTKHVRFVVQQQQQQQFISAP